MKTLLKFFVCCVALLYVTSVNAQDTTRFGVMINGDMSVPSKIAIVNSLGVKYTRMAITMQDWSGSSPAYEKYRDANIDVVLNINWYSHNLNGAPVPFPTNITLFNSRLNAVLTKYPDPALVIVENEETQKDYHSGPMNDYVAELHAAIPIVHGKGLKLANGGIHPQGLCYWVWQDYLDRGKTDSAAWWKTATFSPQMNGGASNPDASINYYWRQIDTLLNAYDTLDIDYVNMHLYEPLNSVGDGVHVTGSAIKIIAEYIKRRTGKQTITNETGQDNEDPALVTNMLTAYAQAKYPWVIWWSGDGTNARALNQSNGVLRDNGNAFRNFALNYLDTLSSSDPVEDTSSENSETPFTGVPYEIIADRVDIKGRGNNKSDLVIHNNTDTVKGFLFNADSGLTKFKVAIDSVWFPDDTIKVRFTDGTVLSKLVTASGLGTITLQQAFDASVAAGNDTTIYTGTEWFRMRGIDNIIYIGNRNMTSGNFTSLTLNTYLEEAQLAAGPNFWKVAVDKYKTNLPSGPGYVLTDLSGNKELTMQPAVSSFAEESNLQWSVLDSIPDPATYTGTINTGDKFLVAAGASGDFLNEDNHIAIKLVSGWNFDTASTGDLLNNANIEYYSTNSFVYKFDGTTWIRVTRPPVLLGGNPVPVRIGPTNANILQLQTNNVPRLSFKPNGDARWPKLAGTGYRLTQVDASGNFMDIPWSTLKDSINLNSKVTSNSTITAATKTKITYDAKGLVTSGTDATTSDIAEGSNLYHTDARSRSSISLTTTGSNGAATYNSSTGVLNVPQYTGGSGSVTSVAKGYGLVADGTITTTGTITVDTTLISTRAWRNKLADSLAALINTSQYWSRPNLLTTRSRVWLGLNAGDTVYCGGLTSGGSAFFNNGNSSYLGGAVGIFTNPVTTAALAISTSNSTASYFSTDISHTSSSTGATGGGLRTRMTLNATSIAAAASYYSHYAAFTLNSTNGWLANGYGLQGLVQIKNTSGGGIEYGKALSAQFVLGDTGTINDASALVLESINKTSGKQQKVQYYHGIKQDTIYTGLVASAKPFFLYQPFNNMYSWINGRTLLGGKDSLANSTLQVQGSVSLGYTTISAAYTVTDNDYTIECTGTTNYNVTLITAVGKIGRILNIINTGTGTITVIANGIETIGNTSSDPTSYTLSPGETLTVQSNNSKYRIL